METALITGASSGIGKSFAQLFASKGINLVITARRLHMLKELKQSLETTHKIQVDIISLDLSKVNSAESLFNEVQNLGIQVDYLINNAGFGGRGLFYEREWKDEAAMMQLNMVTLTQLTHLFLPEMVKRGSGRVLNVASSAGLIPGGPLQSVYFATKAYVVSFSQGIASELEGTGVTVTALCPGATATEFEKVAKLEKTKLFAGKTFSSNAVANDGYKAMMNGDLMCLTALTASQKFTMKTIPFVPTKMILKQIKDLQENG